MSAVNARPVFVRDGGSHRQNHDCCDNNKNLVLRSRWSLTLAGRLTVSHQVNQALEGHQQKMIADQEQNRAKTEAVHEKMGCATQCSQEEMNATVSASQLNDDLSQASARSST
jgi:hypothetical protein